MYLSFYKLRCKPFTSSTDPKFFWTGGDFSRVLAGLHSGASEGLGVFSLTGEPGTGKTILVNVLVKVLDKEVSAYVISCLNLDRLDFLNVIAATLGLGEEVKSEEEFFCKSKEFLRSSSLSGKKVLLILDEAQQLSQEELKDLLALLRNGQQAACTLSILFVGYPTLTSVLDRAMLDHFPALSCSHFSLEPFSEKETTAYIRHRLKIAGAAHDIFSVDALRAIFAYCSGYSALINTVCDLALMFGAAEEKREIGRPIIEECIGRLQIADDRTEKLPVQPLPTEQHSAVESKKVANHFRVAGAAVSEAPTPEKEKENKRQAFSPPRMETANVRKRKGVGKRLTLAAALLVGVAFILVAVPQSRQRAIRILRDWGVQRDATKEKSTATARRKPTPRLSPPSGRPTRLKEAHRGQAPRNGAIAEGEHFTGNPMGAVLETTQSKTLAAASTSSPRPVSPPPHEKLSAERGERNDIVPAPGVDQTVVLAAKPFSRDAAAKQGNRDQPRAEVQRQKIAEAEPVAKQVPLPAGKEIGDHTEKRSAGMTGSELGKKTASSPPAGKTPGVALGNAPRNVAMAEKVNVGRTPAPAPVVTVPHNNPSKDSKPAVSEVDIRKRTPSADQQPKPMNSPRTAAGKKESVLAGQAKPLPAKAALSVGTKATEKVTVVTKPKPTNNPEAAKWINKSLGFLKEQKWDAAATAATHAIALDPGRSEPYANRAWALIEKGDLQKALADIDMALLISPKFVQAINNRGLLQERLGHRDLAVDSYRQACRMGFDLSCRNFEKIRGYPPSKEKKVLLQENVVLFGKGDYEKVIDLAAQVIKLDPSSAEAFSDRCGAMAVLGRLSEAEKDCLEAKRLDPGFSMAYNNMGVIQEKRGDLTAAGKFFRKSCRMGNRLACKNAEKISSRLKSHSGQGS